ncbi:MAG: hydroxymethylglutaryl-CoA synthase [Patescibacteria group bacterium]
MINPLKFTNVGIVSYGVYIPKYRIKTSEVAGHWKKDLASLSSLGVKEKSVADWDEDCLTMAVEASKEALLKVKLTPKLIGACFMGSESFPYAVKPVSTTLANILGIGNEYFSSDLQFACKAGTSAIQIVASMIESGVIDYGLAVGSDKSQSKPNDALEFTAGSGAACFILGNKKSKWIASLKQTVSYSSDTPDFWRREKCSFPSHAGRFTGEPSYFKHVKNCTSALLNNINLKPKDFDYVVFHSPNKKFPQKVARLLGFNEKQLKHSLLVEEIGNIYSGSSLISLANVLDNAKEREKILLTSYGSGAGSDSFYFTTNKYLSSFKKTKLKSLIKKKIYLNYQDYLEKMDI